MAFHNDTGKQGEALAEQYLRQQNFTILHRNWRYSYYEIDIIASRGGVLHFIEVKTRRTDTYGYPEESVTTKKMNSLQQAGAAFLEQYPGWKRIQYDVLSISLLPGRRPAYLLLEDVS